MAKLIKLEFFRGDKGLLAYQEYDDGTKLGGRVSDEEARNLSDKLLADSNNLGGVLMPDSIVKDEDDG